MLGYIGKSYLQKQVDLLKEIVATQKINYDIQIKINARTNQRLDKLEAG